MAGDNISHCPNVKSIVMGISRFAVARKPTANLLSFLRHIVTPDAAINAAAITAGIGRQYIGIWSHAL
ncbi:unnamed protein product [marine sediment metagenome]|uniref:Uncharacterized protein n=1 Tax=marine sediment metagenome TaxID=412755 RepID=X0V1F1_9ZZZZ